MSEPQALATRWRRPDAAEAATIALGVAAGLILADFTRFVGSALRTLLIMLLIAGFLSFAMEPAVQWMSKRGVRRGVATGLVFAAVVLIFGGFTAAMAPLLVDQANNLINAAPELTRNLQAQAQALPEAIGTPLVEWLQETRSGLQANDDFAESIGRSAAAVGTSVVGGVFQSLAIALVTFYLVTDGPKLRRTLSARMHPRRQAMFLSTWELAIEKTGGYVYARVITAITSAVFHIAAFTLLDLNYAIALGAWVGLISSLIPVIGTYLAGVLPLVVALANDPLDALFVLIAISLYQLAENIIIGPKITAHAMELHPAVAFLSVLGGGALLGATGALLALPAVAIAQALLQAAGERHDVVEHGLVSANRRALPERRTGEDRRVGDRRATSRTGEDRRSGGRRASDSTANDTPPANESDPAGTDPVD